MELRHLRYFVAVAEELNFGRAAARLNISQPPLSQQIMHLEREIQVKLLIRSKHKVALTDAGSIFVTLARKIICDAESAIEAAQKVDRGEVAQLRVGHTHTGDLNVLPILLPRFRKSFPNIGITLFPLHEPALIEKLRRKELDVGILRLPADCRDLIVKTIYREPLILGLSKYHPLEKCPRISMTQIADEPLILYPRHYAPDFFDLMATVCRKAGFTMKIAQESDNLQSTLSLISMGFGVSIQPSCVQNIAREGVIFRLFDDTAPHVDMAIVHNSEHYSKVTASFIGMAEEIFRNRSTQEPGHAEFGHSLPIA